MNYITWSGERDKNLLTGENRIKKNKKSNGFIFSAFETSAWKSIRNRLVLKSILAKPLATLILATTKS